MNPVSGRSASKASLRVLERGFTLVELIAVVTIIGVLATIAVYSVRKYIQHAKASEAAEIVGAIKAGEEAYYDETFAYLPLTATSSPNNYYPDHPDNASGQIKIQWGQADGATSCNACGTRMKALGVMPAAPVLFRYSIATGAVNDAIASGVSSKVSSSAFPGNAPQPFYVVNAVSDLNGDGSSKPMSAVVGSNLMGDLYSVNIGE